MKKIISVILCIALIFSISAVSSFAQDKPDLCFAVASDLHYNQPRAVLEHTIDDSVYWYANRRCAMEDESGFIIDEFLKQCGENDDCEFVLISGDMCDNGRTITEDHVTVAQKFRDFESKYNKQIYVINGNHDASEDSNTTYEKFKSIYAEFGYDEAIAKRDIDCSYVADLSDKYRLIALDTNDPYKSTEDGMTTEKLNWVKEQVDLCKEDGKYPILMMHHNLLDHLPIQRVISRNFIIRFHYTTAELFADWGIKIVLTGHEHCSDATSFTSLLGNTIYDFATTSLTMYPLEYRMFSLTEDEIKYEAKSVDTIDYDALQRASEGFTQEQIELMKKDLDAYAKGFLKAGVKYRLQLQLTMEKMGISEDEFYYDIVKTAAERLNEILLLPMTGEGSLTELAAKYGIEIPENNYENGWDLATEIMAYHYSGEENFSEDKPEVTTLLHTVVFVLRDDFAGTLDKTVLDAANQILYKNGMNGIAGEITDKCVELFGTYSATEYLLMTILSPFAYSFANDTDGVNDNNGVLPGYGTVNVQNNINNIKTSIEKFIDKLVAFLNNAIKYIILATKLTDIS